MQKFDFLVIGGGIAGLSYAHHVAEHGTVAVLFKKDLEQSSTNWAQGGIAAVHTADDSAELHIRDTEIAGAGLCHRKTVEIVVSEGPQRLRELIALGAQFDADTDGEYHLHQEGGHSKRRIFHHADSTGHEIQRALLAATKAHPRITFFSPANAIDLITTHKLGRDKDAPNRVVGVYVLHANTGEVEAFLARTVLVATGGAGKVYLYTSNPDVATGDGIAMCARAGVPVANMEFFQFHPTCLFHPEAKSFLITEALRGEGALLRGLDQKRFMPQVHELAELAPRDIVARAIDSEMKRNGWDHVWLDITHRDAQFLRDHFPMIYETCLRYGIDITKQMIPVVPAAHYLCGGVVCDEHGRAGIAGLYVAGECACTGLHGANRLASNSLLEGIVFGYRAAIASIHEPASIDGLVVPAWDEGSARDSDEEVVIQQNWDEIRRLMWNYVGIVRSTKRLQRAMHRLNLIEQEVHDYYWNFKVTSDLLELRNLIVCAKLVVACALQRKESRGLHYTLDYPELNEAERHDTVVQWSGSSPKTDYCSA